MMTDHTTCGRTNFSMSDHVTGYSADGGSFDTSLCLDASGRSHRQTYCASSRKKPFHVRPPIAKHLKQCGPRRVGSEGRVAFVETGLGRVATKNDPVEGPAEVFWALVAGDTTHVTPGCELNRSLLRRFSLKLIFVDYLVRVGPTLCHRERIAALAKPSDRTPDPAHLACRTAPTVRTPFEQCLFRVVFSC